MRKTTHNMNKTLRLRMMKRSLLLAAALLFAVLPGRAADYVLAYRNGNTVYYLARNGTNGVQRVTTFDPATCVWSCASNTAGTTAGTLNNNNTYGYLYQMVGNTRYFLSAGVNSNIGLATTASANDRSYTRWRTNGTYVYNNYRNNNGTTYYINLNNGVARATSASTTCAQPYEYISVDVNSSSTTTLTVPTITPTTATLNFNESQSFTASATATTTTTTIPAHTSFTINTTTYRYYNGSLYTSTDDFEQVAETHPDITYSWTLTGTANSYLSPASGTGSSITITHSPQTPSDANSTLSVTATAGGESQTSTSNATVTAKASTVDPTSVNITSTTPMTLYVGNTGNITYTLLPSPCYNNVTFTSANTGIATVSSTGAVTGVATGQTTISVKAYKYSNPSGYVEATVTVNVRNQVATPTISFVQIGDGATATATISCATPGATIYYKVNDDAFAEYSNSFTVNEYDEVQAYAVMTGVGSSYWDNSTTASETYVSCTTTEPVISYFTSGSTTTVTITAETGAAIYYTYGNNPSNPTTSVYDGTGTTSVSFTGVTNEQVVKAIAKNGTCSASATVSTIVHISGVSGGVVTLNDLEDHRWSYYSDASTPEQLHSLNPADVKITYYGDGIMMTGNADYTASSTDFVLPGNANYVGGAKVNVGGEDENTFVYYKTLERANADGSGRCPYKPIPNPFQVRPTYGSTWDGTNTDTWTGWRGFQCWRLKSVTGGSVYSIASGGTALSTGAVINAETPIYLAPNAEYGMEMELEAVWAIAYVVKANGDAANAIQQQNVGYERNFIVLHSTSSNFNFGGTSGKRITNINYPATVSTYYPDGSQGANAGSTLRGAAGTNLTLEANTKFENIPFSMGSYAITAANHDVIIGRGCTGTVNNLQGINGDAADLDYTIRVESGTFNTLTFVRDGGSTVSGRYLIKAIMGSDYDRATGTNNKLSVSANSHLFFSRSAGFSGSSNKDQKTFDCVFKSGTYQSDQWDEDQNGTNGYLHIAYLGQNGAGTTYPGRRCVTVEGGDLGGMCGGRGVNNTSNNATYMTPEVITFDLRIKGGTFHGGVFGGAADNPSIGSRRFIMTGGEIWGWLAGGCNGTGSQGGQGSTDGNSYIYVGGTALVGGNNAMSIQSTNGGQVFGAGRGHIENGTHRQSSVNYSYVAIADEAVISNDNNGGGNVYGGSYNGIVANEANVYILGGTVRGSVFGGSYGNVNIANNVPFPTTNVKMTGGLVTNGVYGGSNSEGTISGNVTMHIDGGTVGNSESGDGVFGGGYGQNTSVGGNVSVTLGASTSATDSVTVNGNVFGGSALGDVNTNASNTTTVTMNKALINGNLFGGALGNGADVNGLITVTINGGFVNGNVYGGGDAAAYGRAGQNYPVVNMTGGTAVKVFGGGKGNTATVTGNPKVTLSGNAHVTENVYGGGDEAVVTGETSVILRD